MRRPLAALCAAGVASALGSGCSGGEPVSAPAGPTPPTTATATTAAPAVLPPPQALVDVMYRLADPGIPGADKLGLVAGATESDAALLDGFAAAMRDGGFSPLTVSVADIGWSDSQPGDVRAMVTMAGPQPRPGSEFRFPLEFHPNAGGWQLSRDTADMLLAATP